MFRRRDPIMPCVGCRRDELLCLISLEGLFWRIECNDGKLELLQIL